MQCRDLRLTLAAARASDARCSEGCRNAVAPLTAAFKASMGCAKPSSNESNEGPVSCSSTSDSEPDAGAKSARTGLAGSAVLLRFMTCGNAKRIGLLLSRQTKQNTLVADAAPADLQRTSASTVQSRRCRRYSFLFYFSSNLK